MKRITFTCPYLHHLDCSIADHIHCWTEELIIHHSLLQVLKKIISAAGWDKGEVSLPQLPHCQHLFLFLNTYIHIIVVHSREVIKPQTVISLHLKVLKFVERFTFNFSELKLGVEELAAEVFIFWKA